MQLTSLTTNHVRTQTFTVGATAQLTTATSDDFRLGFARSNSSVDTESFCPFYTAILRRGPSTGVLVYRPPSSPARANSYIHIGGVGDSEISTESANSFLHQWNVRNTSNFQVANHMLKFGIDQRHITSTPNPAAYSAEADFFDRQSMVQKLASDVVITRSVAGQPNPQRILRVRSGTAAGV